MRHGILPEREIMTGIGLVGVRQPRIRDREAAGERIRFTRHPAALREAHEEPGGADSDPLLEGHLGRRLRGGAGRACGQGFAWSVGIDDCPHKEGWTDEHEHWQKRDLSMKRLRLLLGRWYHLEARLEDQAQCILVIIGATPEGRKELVGFTDGMRESAQSWRDLLLDLKAPRLGGSAGTCRRRWRARLLEALGEVWPTTREQRCWVHKDSERPKQAAEEPAYEGQARAAGNLDGRDKEGCRHGFGCLRRELRPQIRQGRRLPDEG